MIMQKDRKEKVHIAIEGNIGSGKSTLLGFLGKRLDIPVFPEPVSEWYTLPLFYTNQQRYAFLLQTEILHSLKQLPKKGYFISERSPKASTKVFSKLQFKADNLTVEQYEILNEYENSFLSQPDVILFLNITPEKALERIQKRKRLGEENISLSYLTELHFCYLQWFKETKTPCYFINADDSPEKVAKNTLSILKLIAPGLF